MNRILCLRECESYHSDCPTNRGGAMQAVHAPGGNRSGRFSPKRAAGHYECRPFVRRRSGAGPADPRRVAGRGLAASHRRGPHARRGVGPGGVWGEGDEGGEGGEREGRGAGNVASTQCPAQYSLLSPPPSTPLSPVSLLRPPSPFLSPLPLEALRLPEPIVALLHSLGVWRIEQLQALPRRELSSRFGPELLDCLDRVTGRLSEPLPAWDPPPQFEVCWSAENSPRPGEKRSNPRWNTSSAAWQPCSPGQAAAPCAWNAS